VNLFRVRKRSYINQRAFANQHGKTMRCVAIMCFIVCFALCSSQPTQIPAAVPLRASESTLRSVETLLFSENLQTPSGKLHPLLPSEKPEAPCLIELRAAPLFVAPRRPDAPRRVPKLSRSVEIN